MGRCGAVDAVDAEPSSPAIEAAVDVLRDDGLVAFPTETVWGLAACARSEAAMNALRAWKGRDADQPVSVLVGSLGALAQMGLTLPPLGRRLAERFWPGPLTLVVGDGHGLARGVARSDGALGLRCSSHPLASELARATERAGLGPLTATSLNRHGEAPAADLGAARALCTGAAAPHLLGGADSAFGPDWVDAGGAEPTTVLDLTTDPARVLRPGGVDARALAAFGEAIAAGASPDESTLTFDAKKPPQTPGDTDE